MATNIHKNTWNALICLHKKYFSVDSIQHLLLRIFYRLKLKKSIFKLVSYSLDSNIYELHHHHNKSYRDKSSLCPLVLGKSKQLEQIEFLSSSVTFASQRADLSLFTHMYIHDRCSERQTVFVMMVATVEATIPSVTIYL